MGLLMAWAVISLALSFNLLDFPDLTPEGSLPLGAILFATKLSEFESSLARKAVRFIAYVSHPGRLHR